MRRSTTKRLIAGVCGGVAQQMDISPALVRLIFCLMFVPGVPLYIYLWLTTPAEDQLDFARE